ncbi:HNH endonuclease, partial [Clostridium saudiense]|nr:HNH endonuclease [Clostridium saudiense]
MTDDYICELCKRVGVPKITEHHLVPKERGGKDKPTVCLCEDCHRQIHA